MVVKWKPPAGRPLARRVGAQLRHGVPFKQAVANARAALAFAIAEKPSGRFMIRSRTRVVQRPPEGDW